MFERREFESTDREPRNDTPTEVVEESSRSLDGSPSANARTLVLSTLLSLALVLSTLVAIRLVLPQILESSRYAWHRGELRAEYDLAADQLNRISIDDLSRVSELVSNRVVPSVVHINVRGEGRRSLDSMLLGGPEGDSMAPYLRGQGSGIIVDAQGYILTNYHVLEGATEIEVSLPDSRRARAKVVGFDRKTDLAVLQVPEGNLMPIAWSDSDKVTIGMPVWAVGSPFGLAGSITFGIISSKHRVSLDDTRYRGTLHSDAFYGDLMQSDAAVNPGNSGGPLVNSKGELIGVNTAILGETYRGISFSIPSNVAKRVYEQIRATGKVERGWIGVVSSMERSADGTLKTREGKDGIMIGGFPEGHDSPARDAGIAPGDWIQAIDDEPITDWQTFRRVIGEKKVGAEIKVTIMRGDKRMEKKAIIGVRPDTI